MNIQKQTPKDTLWLDESGTAIPYTRTTPYERTAEKTTYTIASDAIKLHKSIAAFKDNLRATVVELYSLFCKENGGQVGKGKGGATFFNFDRSIKVEVSVQDKIEFDQNMIELAKLKLDELLNDGLSTAKEFIKPMVMDAFKTSGGKLDVKRILGLRRYADRIKDERYSEAMALIDKSVRKPKSREYFRVAIRNDIGEYQYIDLNFSSI